MEDKPFLILFAKDRQEIIAQKVRLASEKFKVIVVDIDSKDSTSYMAKVAKARLILAQDEKDGLRKALRLLAFYPAKKTCFCSVDNYTGIIGDKLYKNKDKAFLKPLLKKPTVWNTALTLEQIPLLTNDFTKLFKNIPIKR